MCEATYYFDSHSSPLLISCTSYVYFNEASTLYIYVDVWLDKGFDNHTVHKQLYENLSTYVDSLLAIVICLKVKVRILKSYVTKT